MKLSEEEKAMLAGECGPVRKIAIEHQIKVGEFLVQKILCLYLKPISWRIPKVWVSLGLNGLKV